MFKIFLRQAIRTRVSVDRNGNRCASARCQRGSVRRQLPYDVAGDDCHAWILTELLAKFAKEDPRAPWDGRWQGGILPDGSGAWVIAPEGWPGGALLPGIVGALRNQSLLTTTWQASPACHTVANPGPMKGPHASHASPSQRRSGSRRQRP